MTEIEEILRKKVCTEKNCSLGDFQEVAIPGGTTIICNSCMKPGENFGLPMMMPKDFTINSAK